MATLPVTVDATTRREAAAFSVDEAVEALRELESLADAERVRTATDE